VQGCDIEDDSYDAVAPGQGGGHAATDALIALRAGYSVAQLASVDYTGFPANYHWPTDTPDNLVWETIGQAIAVTEEFVRGAALRPLRGSVARRLRRGARTGR
jgi:hypothetical protein